MILTGRYVYKKYKKRKADKEEQTLTAQAKHSDLILASQAEISKTPVENLASIPDDAKQSDLPPSYSLTSPTSTLHPSSSVKSSTTSSSSPYPSVVDLQISDGSPPFAPPSQISPATQSHLSPRPTAASPISPQSAASGPPTEIQVHGRWIWVPDESPSQAHAPSIQSAPQVAVNDSIIPELPAVNPLKELPSVSESTRSSEEDDRRGFFVAELDSKQVPAGDTDKEVYVTR
jgi:hypothetical protein